MSVHERVEDRRRRRRAVSANEERDGDVRDATASSEAASVLRLQAQVGNSATSTLVTGKARRPGPVVVSRLKEAPSPFKGAAGTADVRAVEAAAATGGLSPISIGSAYADAQAKRKEAQMDSFRHADIPFVSDNMNHYAYKKLVELRQEYVDDTARISLGESAFNDFVAPGTLANKSTAQFKAIQFELGYSDDMDPTEDLSAKEMKTLGKKLDQKQIKTLNEAVVNKERTTQGLRKEILGTSHNLHGAMQRRLGVLAAEAKDKGEEEKKKVEDKIQAVKDGFETAGKVVELVSFAGFGAPAAIAEVAGGGSTAIKGGLELGGKGVSLIGSTVEFIMTEMYREDIEKAKQAIEKAKAAEAHARKMDAELSITGSMLSIEGQVDQLAGAMGELAAALRARKDYFAALGAETDKATGSRSGSKMSQYLAYVSQAMESKSHLDTALSAAKSGEGVFAEQNNAMAKHRRESYVANSAGVWDDRARLRDEDGPDLEAMRAARGFLDNFTKAATAQLKVIDGVVASMPAPQ